MNDKITKEIKIDNCDWLIDLINPIIKNGEIISVENFILRRKNNKTFHATMVKAQVGDFKFRQPMIIEHGNEQKVGDVVIILRKNPQNHRWMIQFDEEDVYVSEEEIEKIIRAQRSSLDNIKQSVNRKVVKTGDGYSNPRRIGGKRIFQHYVSVGWGPQVDNEMIDIFDYVDSPDSLGQATLLKSLKHMPHEMAREILSQIRKPAE
jgi:hypothetical protein